MINSPIIPVDLEILHLQTPGSRGADGTSKMLTLRNDYYKRVEETLEDIKRQFWSTVNGNTSMSPAIDKLTADLTSIDEGCVIPRPETISTSRQCDDLIWQLNSGLARTGRIWAVANTASSLCEYELSVIEKWLKEKFRLEDSRNVDAKVGIMLQNEKRHINRIRTLSEHAERVYKRIETQLPSLRDLSERRSQESRYRGETPNG